MSYIEAHTLDFLEEIKANNNRDWYHKNKNKYTKARENVLDFIQYMFDELAEEDSRYLGAKPAKSMFRIFKDMRFAKEGAKPYKEHFGIVLSPLGTKSPEPSTYIQLHPKGGFMAMGLWQPDKEKLAAIRQEIDYSDDEFEKIIKKLSKRGWSLEKEDSLKRAPKGYEEDNKNINYIKLKSFVVVQALTRKTLLDKNLSKKIIKEMDANADFIEFLKKATS